jgi:hypothetical protein
VSIFPRCGLHSLLAFWCSLLPSSLLGWLAVSTEGLLSSFLAYEGPSFLWAPFRTWARGGIGPELSNKRQGSVFILFNVFWRSSLPSVKQGREPHFCLWIARPWVIGGSVGPSVTSRLALKVLWLQSHSLELKGPVFGNECRSLEEKCKTHRFSTLSLVSWGCGIDYPLSVCSVACFFSEQWYWLS